LIGALIAYWGLGSQGFNKLSPVPAIAIEAALK